MKKRRVTGISSVHPDSTLRSEIKHSSRDLGDTTAIRKANVFSEPPLRANPENGYVNLSETETAAMYSLMQIQRELYSRDPESITAGDLLDYITKLQQCRKNSGRPDRASRNLTMSTQETVHNGFSGLIEALFSEYCTRVRYQVREWLLKSCRECRSEISPRSDLATGDPEDVVYVINMQMSVARENLSPFHCMDVLLVILEEVQQMQRLIRKSLNSIDEDFVIERACAIINYCACLYERIDNLNITNDLLDGQTFPSYNLKKKKDQVTIEYINLAIHATDLLAQVVMSDLRPILITFHSSQWEYNEKIIVLLSTFRDYFRDLKSWLPAFFYAKVTRKCLELLLEMYLESFFTIKGRLDKKTTAALLERDRLNLVHFFSNEYFEEMKQTGLAGEQGVEDRFEILRAMQFVILAKDPSDVHSEVQLILRELGNHNGKIAILFLRTKLSCQRQKKKEEVALWNSPINDACETNSAAALRARTQCELSHLYRSRSVFRARKLVFHHEKVSKHGERKDKRQMSELNQPQVPESKFGVLKAIPKLFISFNSLACRYVSDIHLKRTTASC